MKRDDCHDVRGPLAPHVHRADLGAITSHDYEAHSRHPWCRFCKQPKGRHVR